MITKFGVKNFKRFEDTGMIQFSDITLLVGPNNSGKSSFIKALILMNENIAHQDKSIYLDGLTFALHSTTGNNINLGTFNRVVNDKASKREITLCAEFKDCNTDRSRLIEIDIESRDSQEYFGGMRNIKVRDVLNEIDTYEFDFSGDIATIHIPYDMFINVFSQLNISDIVNRREAEREQFCPAFEEGILAGDTNLDCTPLPIVNIDNNGNGSIVIGNRWNSVCVKKGFALVDVFCTREDRNDMISSLIAGINVNPYSKVPYGSPISEEMLDASFRFGYNRDAIDLYLKDYRDIAHKSLVHIEFIHAHSITNKVFFTIADRNDYVARTLHEAYLTRSLFGENVQFIKYWLTKFNIGEGIEIRRHEGDGYTVKIVGSDGTSKNLADIGTGAGHLILLLIKVATIIKTHKTDNVLLVLEEPEQNMHPNYQSLLADLFFALQQNGIKLLIETHSEYLIRRSQVIVAKFSSENNYTQENLDKENPFRVVYFPESGKPYDMHYKVNGDFEHLFGEGFFDAAAKNRVELYKMQLDQNR